MIRTSIGMEDPVNDKMASIFLVGLIKGLNGSITLPHCLDCFRLERKLPGGISSSHWI